MKKHLAQDYSVVWHNPDRSFYVEGCGLVNLGGGSLLAVVAVIPRHSDPLFARRSELSKTHILRSTDGGITWGKASELPYYSSAVFAHDGAVYLFGNKGGTEYRNDDLDLVRSTDDGLTWSAPVTLFKGHFWNCQTNMVKDGDTVYWVTCDLPPKLQYGPPQRRPRVIAGDLSRDLMDPKSWRLSAPADFPEVPREMIADEFEVRSHSLEASVINVEGRLRVVACTKPTKQSTAGLAAVFDLSDNDGVLNVEFAQYHPRPGGQLKFDIVWDPVSRMFWSTGNLVVDSQSALKRWQGVKPDGNDRRFLMLFYGIDGLNWFQAGCVAQAGKLSQSFNYPAMVVDGDDLCVISRSNIDGPNSHDADYATFHRISNFRDLALELEPDPE